METILRFVFLAAMCFAVQGSVFRAVHLSNKSDVEDLCAGAETNGAEPCTEAGAYVLTAHPADCRLYLQCVWVGLAPVCRQCPAGLHFNSALRLCDHPEHAGCKDGNGTTIAPESELAPDDIPARCRERNATAVSCAAQQSPDALLPHPDDCALFYYCVSAAAAPVCRQCSAGLHFSPALHVCDAPELAGCLAPA